MTGGVEPSGHPMLMTGLANAGLSGDAFMSTILIVEDEAPLLILAESVLQGAGYETLTAATSTEVQSIIQSDAQIDLLFTDLGLGDQLEAGLELGRSTAEARPALPILYTSGRALTDGMRSLFIEKSDFLPKPYTNDQLIAAIKHLLKGG